MTIKTCVQVDRLPVNDSSMYCMEDEAAVINITTFDKKIISYFPYPRVGKWFLALKAVCYNRTSG